MALKRPGTLSAAVFPKLPTDTPELRTLCERLVPGEAPDLLEVEHPPHAELNECVANVERVVAKHGGTIQYGWQLWETLPGVMLEAEFHAVWVDPTGTYRDLTPKRFGFQQSVFLADPSLTYDGKQINNVRVALNHDMLIEEFIAAADQYYEATNRGRLAHLHGDEYLAALTTEQRAGVLTIQKRQEKLSLLIAQKYYGLSLS